MQEEKKSKKILKLIGILFVVFAMVAVICLEYYNRGVGMNVNAASDGCPSIDWVPVGDFCIMSDILGGGPEQWNDAAYNCLDQEDARLCTTAEWMEACRLNQGNIISLDNMEADGTDEYEWLGDLEDSNNGKAAIIGENGCSDISSERIAHHQDKNEVRCCINRERY